MPTAIISVENLSKRYVIQHQRCKDDGLRHRIEEAVRSPWRWTKRLWQSRSGACARSTERQAQGASMSTSGREEFWALKDVSFEVNQGDVVGIIGRNGAGKSTLLKILSRITEPTSGRITLNGRVASLLEVGTGFHPELTGRENIFLNGAILGMSKTEITRKFDEIVAFSEVERFLDTPVKRYSSGMYVRLAFAVAAHLEPEILIVDEVLAVGDAQFQQKCLGKMSEVATSGRTVLFVSHNMAAVKRLCRNGLYLTEGKNRAFRDVDEIVNLYAQDTALTNATLRHSVAEVVVRFFRADGSPLKLWSLGEEITAEVQVRASRILLRPAVDLAFYDMSGVRVFALQSDATDHPDWPQESRSFMIRFHARNPGFCAQELTVDVGVRADGGQTHLCWWQRVEVIPISLRGLSFRPFENSVVAVPFLAEFAAVASHHPKPPPKQECASHAAPLLV